MNDLQEIFQTLQINNEDLLIDVQRLYDNPKLANTVSACFKEFFSLDTLTSLFQPDFISKMEVLGAFILSLHEYNIQNNIPDEFLKYSVMYYKKVFNTVYDYEYKNGTQKREILNILVREIEKGYQDHLYYLNTLLGKKSKKRTLNKIFLFILIASLVLPSIIGYIAYQYQSRVLMFIAFGLNIISPLGFIASIIYFLIYGGKKRR